MAKVKFSGLIEKMSGKLGGSIFVNSSQGGYIKQNAYSQQHATEKQSAQRTQIYQTSQIWRTLSPAQIAVWEAAIPNYPFTNNVGEAQYYTAYQLFNYLNQVGLSAELDIILVPDEYYGTPTPANALTDTTGTTTTLVLSNLVNDNKIIVYASPYQSTTAPPPISRFRKITVLTADTTISDYSIGAQYVTVFPNQPIGTYFWVYTKQVGYLNNSPSSLSDLTRSEKVS